MFPEWNYGPCRAPVPHWRDFRQIVTATGVTRIVTIIAIAMAKSPASPSNGNARSSRNRAACDAPLAGDDAAVFHFVDPIARFGNRRIVRGQQQGFPAFVYQISQQFEGALGVRSIEVACGF